MFCNGESPATLSDVLDKSKNKPPDIPKITVVQMRSNIQILLERVSKLEDSLSKSVKSTKDLERSIADLKNKNRLLQTENEQLREKFNTQCI